MCSVVAAAQGPPHAMGVVPPCQVGDLLVPDGAETVWRLPQMQEPLTTSEVGFPLHAEARFAVHLPRGIIGGCSRFDLRVALHRHGGGLVEILRLARAVGGDSGALHYPGAVALSRAVLLGNPSSMCVRGSSLRPTPEGRKDCGSDCGAGPRTRTVAVRGRPASDDRVELDHAMSCRGLLVGPEEVSDFFQPGVGVLFGRNPSALPAVLAAVVTEKVDARCDGRDTGCFRREPQAAFLEQPFHPRRDFLVQHLVRAAGDEAIIRPPHEVDEPGVSLTRGERLAFAPRFPPVPCQVTQHWCRRTAWRCPCVGRMPRALRPASRLQPWP